MVIYEVNLKIEANIQEEYMNWLTEHILEMLQFPGFIEATTLRDYEIEDTSFIHLTVHYTIDSKKNLQLYLEKHAQAMRAKGLKLFPNKFTATRRIFEVIQQTLITDNY